MNDFNIETDCDAERLKSLLQGMHVDDIDNVIKNYTADQMYSLGKRYAFLCDSLEPTPLAN